jgi:hypothetical protein
MRWDLQPLQFPRSDGVIARTHPRAASPGLACLEFTFRTVAIVYRHRDLLISLEFRKHPPIRGKVKAPLQPLQSAMCFACLDVQREFAFMSDLWPVRCKVAKFRIGGKV